MRIKYTKLIAFIIVFVNIGLVYYALRLFSYHHKIASFGVSIVPSKIASQSLSSNKFNNKPLEKLLTIIIREFEAYDNDISATIESIQKISPKIQIYILYDEVPYPPLNITTNSLSYSHLKLFSLSPVLGIPLTSTSPLGDIETKYVLFVPDSTRLISKESIQKLLCKANKNKGAIIVSPVARNRDLECFKLNVSVREWKLRYNLVKSSYCDAINGNHVTLIETELLRTISNPFLLPFPSSLYIQTAALNIKVFILKTGLFHEGRMIFRTHHAQWKFKQVIQQRLSKLYKLFKIKLVVREGKSEWYGCNRDSSRCFGEVLNSVPSYLYENKWTPPCCLANLRKTAKYVLEMLDQFGIRYWLEGGSLLGAVRSGDILPWDYKVDVGFIQDDSSRCKWFQMAKNKSVVDNKGFYWEKVKSGNHFRIHFSKYNRIFVNLFPFFHKNNTFSRDIFYDSFRNMEFADNFLHPMSSIEFIGRNVPCPNNVRDFLEYKFGKGCIENPQYPNKMIL